jgi:hypothetical protein
MALWVGLVALKLRSAQMLFISPTYRNCLFSKDNNRKISPELIENSFSYILSLVAALQIAQVADIK